ncbi:hypothetical protein [Actinacidiphila sp. bgisy167]|uniref:hypothetical protein n=1 Tax=Actinacidiphila sp. bgisy167 TaxID=3413797 RepID=UPI003D7168BB
MALVDPGEQVGHVLHGVDLRAACAWPQVLGAILAVEGFLYTERESSGRDAVCGIREETAALDVGLPEAT